MARHGPSRLVLSVIVYPLFAAAMIGFIAAGTRARAIGSPWIAWLGVIGALGQGVAAPLTIGASLSWASNLFPLLEALAIWLVLVALSPRRSRAAVAPA